jgi:hypothetical protein
MPRLSKQVTTHHTDTDVHKIEKHDILDIKKEEEKINTILFDLDIISSCTFIIYLGLLSSYTGFLLPNRVINFFKKNKVLHYIVVYLILLFTIKIYDDSYTFDKVLIFSIVILIMLVLILKQVLITSIIIFILLLISFISYNIQYDNRYLKDKTKNEIEQINKKYIIIQHVCFFCTILVAIIGSLVYYAEKYKKYRGQSSSYFEFLFKYLFYTIR